jgi:hypothetical protein
MGPVIFFLLFFLFLLTCLNVVSVIITLDTSHASYTYDTMILSYDICHSRQLSFNKRAPTVIASCSPKPLGPANRLETRRTVLRYISSMISFTGTPMIARLSQTSADPWILHGWGAWPHVWKDTSGKGNCESTAFLTHVSSAGSAGDLPRTFPITILGEVRDPLPLCNVNSWSYRKLSHPET